MSCFFKKRDRLNSQNAVVGQNVPGRMRNKPLKVDTDAGGLLLEEGCDGIDCRNRRRGNVEPRVVVVRAGEGQNLDGIRAAVFVLIAAAALAAVAAATAFRAVAAMVDVVAGSVGMDVVAGNACKEGLHIYVAVVGAVVDVESNHRREVQEKYRDGEQLYENGLAHRCKCTNFWGHLQTSVA